MKEFFEPHVIISLAVMVGSISMVAMTLIIVLRDKISGVFVSRTGVEIRTNDISAWSKVVDKIERIDSGTSKSIRKATTGLEILNPEEHEMSADAMLVILKANQPLIGAAHENHHTRELLSDGGDAYIADKTRDIIEVIRHRRILFPELTNEKSEAFACLWLKKILLPNLRRACVEKVTYYTSKIAQSDLSKSVKEMLAGCRDKNVRYLDCIDKLAARPDIDESIARFYPAMRLQTAESKQQAAEKEAEL